MKPIAKIVCWNCRKTDKQLFNVRTTEGKKTQDYICVECKPKNYYPPVEDMSKVFFPKDDGKKKGEVKTVAIEGDIVT